MAFDPKTLMTLMAVVAATVGLLLIFAWLQRRAHRALAIWGAADLAVAFSTALIMTRGHTSDLVSVKLAFLIIASAYGLMWTAARAFSGRPPHSLGIAVGPAIWLVACAVPEIVQSTQARMVLISAIAATYMLATARELWRDRGERLLSRYPMVGCLVLHACFQVVRSVAVLMVPPPNAETVLHTPWVAVMIFEPIVLVIVSGFLQLSMTKERAEAVQQHAATTDELTGVANRRAFLEEGQRRLAAATAQGAPVALLLFDLDHFKRINDGYGHDIGDEVLRTFAKRATEVLRPGDLFGRVGGEEFAALLSNTGQDSALGVAERFRDAIGRLEISASGLPVPLTVSVGVSTGAATNRELGELLRQADHALYNAKSAGRNCVRLSGPRVAPLLRAV